MLNFFTADIRDPPTIFAYLAAKTFQMLIIQYSLRYSWYVAIYYVYLIELSEISFAKRLQTQLIQQPTFLNGQTEHFKRLV